MQKAEKRFDRPNKEYAVTPERLREIATGAVLRGDFLTEETQEVAYALFAYAGLLEAKAPPEATATQYDELAKYSRDDGLRDWVSVGAWLHPGERIVIESPAEPSAPVEPQGPQWIQCSERIPPEDTPVLILRNGELRIGAIFTESPGHEETFKAFNYWDDPNDDGQCWEWHEVTHWMPLPSTPVTKAGS